IPKADRPVCRPGGKDATIRGECQRTHPRGMGRKRMGKTDSFTPQVPDTNLPVASPSNHSTAVGGDGDGKLRRDLPFHRIARNRLGTGNIPQVYNTVLTD